MKAFTKLSAQTEEIVLAEVPKPEISDQELLVKVEAVGVGIHDEYFFAPDVKFPYVIGIEAAGVIEQVGGQVEDYQVGQRIAFVSAMQSKGGTWAEYAAIASSTLILLMPDDMSFEQAAAMPVPANTALKAMSGAGLKAGDSLFIAGGAGAIGTLLIQLAKQQGLTVVASASTKNHDYMTRLGADHVVDYHDGDWQEQVKAMVPNGVDAAIAIHPGTAVDSQPVVKDGGVIVAVSGDQFETERGIILKQVFSAIDVKTELAELVAQVASGEVKQVIDKVYPFEQALDALAQVKTRHTRGKLVLSMTATDVA